MNNNDFFTIHDSFTVQIDKRFTSKGTHYVALKTRDDYEPQAAESDSYLAELNSIKDGADVDARTAGKISILRNILILDGLVNIIREAELPETMDGILQPRQVWGFDKVADNAKDWKDSEHAVCYKVHDNDVEFFLVERNQPDNVIYVIQYGKGEDGGFGDYSQPFWSDPMTFNSELLYFTDPDAAARAVCTLNKESSDAFYTSGVHRQYDGEFEIEYQIIPVPDVVPSNEERSPKDIVDIVRRMHGGIWANADI